MKTNIEAMTKDAGLMLRCVVAASGLTQTEVLARYNKGQAKPMALRTFKTYLAKQGSKTRVRCPTAVLERVQKVLGMVDTVQSCTNNGKDLASGNEHKPQKPAF